ncbi:MAG: PSD1 and planctomycete cytochrome C domain-containing protein [Pirellulaceae bacterium]
MKWMFAPTVLALHLLPLATIAEDKVEYLRDVKPILATRCYRCHSSLEQESNFRLDSVPALVKGGDGGAGVVPGKSGESRLIAAVLRQGDLKMPPEGDPLTAKQIETLKAWIDQGATPPPEGAEAKVDHWSFKKPVRPAVPMPANSAFVRNPVDAFVAAKHEELKLKPVDEASQQVLLRRVYLDLIGLPPTPQQMQDFLNDNSPDAYEKVVHSLLNSPHHGERWGRHWMDVWRYSDWDGYGAEIRESQPHIWRWRDWIVESLNADRPYDRMIEEMLAGDELAPEAPATIRATGYLVRNWYKFNRNTWLDNTVEHTGKAFMGVTFNCARCHDHMYDPISQEEYYKLRAVFEPHDIRLDRVPGQSDTAKDGLARVFDAKAETQTFLFVRGNDKDPVKDKPLAPAAPKVFQQVSFDVQPVNLPSTVWYPGLQASVQAETLAAAKTEIEKAKAAVMTAQQALATAKQQQAEFAAKAAAEPDKEPSKTEPAKPSEPLIADDFGKQKDDVWKLGPGKWEYKDGRLIQSDPQDVMCGITSVQSHPRDFVAKLKYKLTGGDTYKSVGIAFDAVGDKDLQAVYLSAAGPGPHWWQKKGGVDSYPVTMPKETVEEVGKEYELTLAVKEGVANVSVNGRMVLACKVPAQRASEGRIIFWTYDATAEFLRAEVSPLPTGLVLTMPGGVASPANQADALAAAVADGEKSAAIAEKTLAAASSSVVSIEARIAADKAAYANPPTANAKELALAAGKTERELALLNAEKAWLQAEIAAAKAKRAVKPNEMATAKAATDADTAVQNAIKARDSAQAAIAQPNEAYSKLTPVYPTTSTGRRLALAKFISSKENPLTARVAINHIWLRHFGTPLVPSVFDFGLNGKQPTNQPLLDWLAVELIESGWSQKHIHRLIVTSRTYRLSSTASGGRQPPDTSANSTIDSENKYYWRQNPRRMEAEIVRDATLYVAGSLDVAMGGPDIDNNTGLTSNRRSIYFRSTKEKKMQFLSLFDSANVVECYRRSESIAPQQALAMANSSLTLAQSRLLAKKLSEALAAANPPADQADAKFVEDAFSRTLNRPPSSDEQTTCVAFLTEQAQRLAAGSLSPFTAGPAATVPPSADPRQRARENLVHVLMNHNDFLTVR